MSWWPFRKRRQEEEDAKQQFKDMLNEAFLSNDDLEEAARKLREDRERRNQQKEEGKSFKTSFTGS